MSGRAVRMRKGLARQFPPWVYRYLVWTVLGIDRSVSDNVTHPDILEIEWSATYETIFLKDYDEQQVNAVFKSQLEKLNLIDKNITDPYEGSGELDLEELSEIINEDWSRGFSDGKAPKFRFGGNYGDTPEEVHFHHRLFMTFYLKYSKKKIHRRNKSDLALWQSFYTKFLNYGCYCFTTSPSAKGEGNSVDKLDETCKNLMRCEKCLALDRENRLLGSNCPLHRGYHYRAKYNRDRTQPFIYCHKGNDKCQKASCACDRRFAMQMAKHIDSWDQENVAVSEKYGYCRNSKSGKLKNFNKRVKNDDFRSMASKQIADQCCGTYPFREPFANGGPRDCCGTKLYSVASKECCSEHDSNIKKRGTC